MNAPRPPSNGKPHHADRFPHGGRSAQFGVKVYLVVLPNNVARPGEPNTQFLAWKLTREAAQKIVDRTPGAYIVRGLADKA